MDMSEENIATGTHTEEEKSDFSGIFDILSKLGGAPSTAASTPETSSATGGSTLISSLLSNPELLSKLPDLISVVSPLLSGLSLGGNATAPSSPSLQSQAKPTGAITQTQSREVQNSNALLCALKPYLKKERQDAIDYMIKLSRLGDILKTL